MTFNSSRIYLWPFILLNCIIMSITVDHDIFYGIIAGLSLCFLSSYGFLINDICDRNIDRVNLAGRLENADRSTIRVALIIALSFLIIALFLSLIDYMLFALLVIISVVLTLYSILLRKFLIISTITAALLSLSPLWVPLIGRRIELFHLGITISMFIMLTAREIILDVKDRKGDKEGGRRTLPSIVGPARAKNIAFFLMLLSSLLMLLTLIPSLTLVSSLEAAVILVPACAFIFLIIKSGLGTLNFLDEKISIEKFIIASRRGMALIPIVLLFEWLLLK
ncbi:MAG: UbiA family prenyltransferase [Patescibacteria group bacterium]